MKKSLLFLLLTVTSFSAFSQGAAEDEMKNFRFGLKGAGVLSWMKPDAGINTFNADGVSFKANYGLTTLFRLNKIVSLNTGLEVSYIGGNMKLVNSPTTRYYSVDPNDEKSAYDSTFQIGARKFNATYLDLPILLKMQTGEIGLLTYYGQFGFNLSTRASYIRPATARDENYANNKQFNKNVDISKDIAFFRFGLDVGAGVEFNLFGSTSAVVGFNYYQGFTNMLKEKSETIKQVETVAATKTTTAVTTIDNLKQNAKNNFVSLSFGILF